MYNFHMKNEEGEYPKRYRIEFIEPGVISYEDIDQGIVLVRRPALDRMRKSYIGMPVVNEEHMDLTPNQAFKWTDETALADGVVADVGTTEGGWDYVDVLIWNKDTIENIDKNGYSASCSYIPNQVAEGGTYHGIEYDEEVLDGKYTHLAIVENPRYEGVTIYENSKRSKPMARFKFGKKKNALPPPEEPEEKKEPEESKENMEGTYLVVDGEKIPIEEAMAAYRQRKENEATEINPEDTIDIDGETVTGADLIAACKAMKEASNAEPPQETPAEPVVNENSKRKEKQKKNKHFQALENAANTAPEIKPDINTKSERIDRGKQRYGTAVPIKREVS